MDEPNIQEKSKIRRVVQPLIGPIIDKLDELKDMKWGKVEVSNLNVLEKAFVKALSVFKFPTSIEVSNLPETQKVEGRVEVTNPQKIDLRGVESLLRGLKLHVPDKQTVNVDGLVEGKFEATNLPVGKGKEVHKKDANPSEFMIVRLSNGQEFIDNLGATMSESAGTTMEKVWLREEYTYTTVSGTQVPSQVVKWDDQFKLTVDYAYDNNANPITMTRSIEPSAGVGA